MIRLAFDDSGRVSGLPESFPPTNELQIEIIGTDLDISENDNSELTLALPAPLRIINGVWTVAFGAGSFSVEADEVSAYSVGLALNRLSTIVSAGGVTTSGKGGLVTVAFDEVGALDAISLTHSYLGAMSGRCRIVRAGSVSAKALYELDFTVQTLAKSTEGEDIEGAEVTVSNVATGDSDTAQHDRITISRHPQYGKFQVWTRGDLATAWLPSNVSSYSLEMELEGLEPGEFIVFRNESGGTITFDLLRSNVGVNPAPTVSDAFVGPVGVEMTLDCSLVGDLLRAAGVDSGIAFLAYTHEGEMKFSQPVSLSPVFVTQPQPL